jgi:hypothetical protein
MSPLKLISIAEPHYGEPTGRSLFKLDQMAGMDDADANDGGRVTVQDQAFAYLCW